MLEGFRIIDVIMELPSAYGPVMVMYFGPNFEVSKSTIMHRNCDGDVKLYKRMKKVIDGNYIFSNDSLTNEDLITFITQNMVTTDVEQP